MLRLDRTSLSINYSTTIISVRLAVLNPASIKDTDMFNAQNVLYPSFVAKPPQEIWRLISPLYSADEADWLAQLIPLAQPSEKEESLIKHNATELISLVRADKTAVQMIDALLLEYSLDTKEGILLMCLAEALMRVPDSATADALIRDKLSVADWHSHLKNSDSTFVNASTWGLLLTGKVVNLAQTETQSPTVIINRLVNKVSEPIIRQAMNQAMKIMGHQFVLGRTIQEAQKKGQSWRQKGFTYSFDMLGEAALTRDDAKKYYDDYIAAIESVGAQKNTDKAPDATVSIKLSALHPRYEMANKTRVLTELHDTVLALLVKAKACNVGITIDAEEADRLELSLMLFEKLYGSAALKGWGKFGLVVQAYSKRALPTLAWLASIAKEQGDIIPVRLVKGAYWDTELKLSQQSGFSGYPVFTRKEGTDVSYLACARFLLSESVRGLIYPQFASHNAHTVSAIASMTTHRDFEFQRLHGMGDALYQHALAMYGANVRIYAPVGSHKDLLPYLVRRLLENGANSSFVHRLVDANCPISELTEHPVAILESRPSLQNNLIPLPTDIFTDRKNSGQVNIDILNESAPFHDAVDKAMAKTWLAKSVISGHTVNTPLSIDVTAPYDRREIVGQVEYASENEVQQALSEADAYQAIWQGSNVIERAQYLENLADLLELNTPELVALCHKEAGKTIHDSLDEVREAVDFCRYYAQQARDNMANAEFRANFDGSTQQVVRQGKGIFVCISPWNFPLAIFLGQITAALVSGNTVIAKPAEQTNLIAARAMALILEAGVPAQAIHLVLGRGREVGQQLVEDCRIAGVVFTGSTVTAQAINRTLTKRQDIQGTTPQIATFIAETGGQNTMIVDSTALPEQVVRDVMRSAFASAGQRCSALRVLYVQADIADRILALIKGAMAELNVGLPYLHDTDVGPVIDKLAQQKLQHHIDELRGSGRVIAEAHLDESLSCGDYIAPIAVEIKNISQLKSEHFGPILHVIRFKANEQDAVVEDINNTGFGLTMGIHSRNERTYTRIEQQVKVGNCYINRDQVGAVVGVQPFGGQGLSGTGPKAGGPHYLYRFTQQVVSE